MTNPPSTYSPGVRIIAPPKFSLGAVAGQIAAGRGYVDLLLTLSLHRVKVRYKQSALGFAWAVIQPLALMLIYTLIFSVVTRMPSNDQAYPVFVFCALLPWTFFNTALTSASNSLVSHQYLITKVYFPREILPLTYVIAALFDLGIASVILAAMMG